LKSRRENKQSSFWGSFIARATARVAHTTSTIRPSVAAEKKRLCCSLKHENTRELKITVFFTTLIAASNVVRWA
jgi:hypothetical protein